MSKYIIKNCPAYDEGNCASPEGGRFSSACKHKDCLLKDVIELCNENIRPNESNLYRAGRMSLAVNIRGIFDIEECK